MRICLFLVFGIACFSKDVDFLKTVDFINIQPVLYLDNQDCFTEIGVVDFLYLLKDLGKLDGNLEFSKIWFPQNVMSGNAFGFICLEGESPLFIKLLNKEKELWQLSVLIKDPEIEKYNKARKADSSLPLIVLPKYLCYLNGIHQYRYFTLFPLVRGVTLGQCIQRYNNKRIDEDELYACFFSAGKAFANFQNYFMNSSFLTKRYGDTSFDNIMISPEHEVFFIDMSAMLQFKQKRKPCVEFRALLELGYHYYFCSKQDIGNSKALEVCLRGLIQGYIEVIDKHTLIDLKKVVLREINRMKMKNRKYRFSLCEVEKLIVNCI